MNPTESKSGNPPAAGWLILGELELTLSSSPDVHLRDWLMEILDPLHLHDSFLKKVLTSAQDSVMHALHPTNPASDHVHLAIFIQQDHSSRGGTWGFFRIEKIDNADQNPSHPDHTVEFYLYLEGP